MGPLILLFLWVLLRVGYTAINLMCAPPWWVTFSQITSLLYTRRIVNVSVQTGLTLVLDLKETKEVHVLFSF